MQRLLAAALGAAFLLCAIDPALAASKRPPACARLHLDATAQLPLREVALPPGHICTPRVSRGYPLPDPSCSPGAVNPSVHIETLRDKRFRTTCLRDGATSAAAKNKTYAWYRTPKPKGNTGATQRCELDHIISLELGGADTLENIWPQCTLEKGVKLRDRGFKVKDLVENYLAKAVRDGAISLEDAQQGIADDWTQFIAAAAKARAK